MELPAWLQALLLAIVVVPTAIATWFGLLPYFKLRRMRAAERAALPSDECLACGSRELDRVAQGVARCRACGFVGGPGMVARQRERRLEALRRLTPAQLRALALTKLCEAQRLLPEAQESIEDAAKRSIVDIVGLSPDRGVEKLNSFGVAVRHMRTAYLLATEAAEAVQLEPASSEPDALQDSALLVSLDTA